MTLGRDNISIRPRGAWTVNINKGTGQRPDHEWPYIPH